MHKHRAVPKLREEKAWQHCVTPYQCAGSKRRERAHGGVLFIDYCACGASRPAEWNAGQINYGQWEEAE